MNVLTKLWEKTEAREALYFFSGNIGEFLQKTTPQSIIRAEKFLPVILWRWYFLERETDDHLTPYHYLEMLQLEEKWPEQGQFLPKTKLEITKTEMGQKPKIKIDLTLDYISFTEQPLFVDIISLGKKQNLHYSFGNKYHNDINFMRKILSEKQIDIKKLPTNADNIALLYFALTLAQWREKDKLIQEVFKPDSWILFWKNILKQIAKKKYLDTSLLLDEFVFTMRTVFPKYSLTSEELKSCVMDEKNIHVREEVVFWIDLAYYFLLPLSWHLNLLAPVFIDRENFKQDILCLIEEDFDEPIPIYAPCTYISLTPFGEKIFS